MTKPVNDIVSKLWATEANKILTANAQDITTLFTKLFTLLNQENEKLKSQVAQNRVRLATNILIEATKYGWAFGINNQQVRFTRPTIPRNSRRIRALIATAVDAGHAIGEHQAKRAQKAGGGRTTPGCLHRPDTQECEICRPQATPGATMPT